MRYEDMVKATQAIVDANPSYAGKVKVSYDTVLQKLTFTSSGNDKVTISSTQSSIGLTNPIVQGVNDESVGLTLAPCCLYRFLPRYQRPTLWYQSGIRRCERRFCIQVWHNGRRF
jgi:hypothetical protein